MKIILYFIFTIITFIILNIVSGILYKKDTLYRYYESYIEWLLDEYDIGSLGIFIISLLWPILLLILLVFIINELVIKIISYILKIKQ